MKKICFFIMGLVLFGFMGTCFSQGNETVTITTYYPAPYGAYSRLRMFPDASDGASGIGVVCNALGTETGLIRYDPDDSQVLYCNGATWRPLGSNWTLSGTQLYSNNTNWNIGIGTTSPSERLTVLVPNNEAFLGLSGESAAVTSMAIGRTSQEARLGIAAFEDAFAGGAVAGDAVLRVDDSSKKLHLLTGTGAAVLTVTSSNVGIGNISPLVRLHVGNAGVGDARIEGLLDIGWTSAPSTSASSSIFPGSVNTTAPCPAGSRPISGGCDCGTSATPPPIERDDIQMTRSNVSGTGWYCECYCSNPAAISYNVTAYVYCARVQ